MCICYEVISCNEVALKLLWQQVFIAAKKDNSLRYLRHVLQLQLVILTKGKLLTTILLCGLGQKVVNICSFDSCPL